VFLFIVLMNRVLRCPDHHPWWLCLSVDTGL